MLPGLSSDPYGYMPQPLEPMNLPTFSGLPGFNPYAYFVESLLQQPSTLAIPTEDILVKREYRYISDVKGYTGIWDRRF